MKKRKRKISKRTKKNIRNKQTRQMLVGFFVLAIVTSLVFSVYYIIQSKSNDNINKTSVEKNIGLEKKSSVIDASFKEGVTYLGSHCAGVCHMIPKNKGDVLVKYNGDIIISGDVTSDSHHFTDHLNKALKIPVGKYAVKLESFDSYVGRKSTDSAGQKEEQYKVVFKNGGKTLAQTKETKDLRDDRDEANAITVVNGPNNPIVLSKDADKIIVQHTGAKGSGDAGNLNGFEPVCMLMKKIDKPHCGDGVVNDGEKCDDGNTKDGDGCNSVCQLERGGIYIIKTVSPKRVKKGGEVTYTYDIQNVSKVNLTKIKLIDDKLGTVSCPKTSLQPQEKMICKKNITITKPTVNTATVTAYDANNNKITSTAHAQVNVIGEKPKEIVEPEKKKDEPSCKASIGDYIWYDTNNNGVQEDIEEGISGIKVCAYKGDKKYCDTTNKNGKYKIKKLCKGTYKVKVKGVDKMTQTYDPDSKKDNRTKVKLKDNDKHTKADFGYRGKAPSTGLVTNVALLIGLSTLITIGILLFMRRRNLN